VIALFCHDVIGAAALDMALDTKINPTSASVLLSGQCRVFYGADSFSLKLDHHLRLTKYCPRTFPHSDA
jgi:hypothetical protein